MMESASTDANPSLDKNSIGNDTKMTKLNNEISQKHATTSQPNSSTNTASFAELFSLATPYDIVLMTLGVIGSIGTGVSIPIFNVLFGKMLELYGKGLLWNIINMIHCNFIIIISVYIYVNYI